MPNLRIIYDNAADRGTTVASTTAGSLAVANLRTDLKSQVHRFTGTSGTYTQTWTNLETIGAVVLAYTNLTATATIRIRGYTNTADAPDVAVAVFDSGAILACAASGGTGVNAFSYGGGAHARAWLASQASVRKVFVELVDTANASPIEGGKLFIASYFEASKNADYGASATPTDTSKISRTDGGDRIVDPGAKYNGLQFTLSKMSEADANAVWNILWGNSVRKPVFVSLFPNDAAPGKEQRNQVAGGLVSLPSMGLPSFNIQTATLQIEGL